MSEKNNNYNNNINNIGIIPSNKEFMNINQLNNNASLQLNNYNNLSPYIDSNLNFNNLLLLNSNKNISNINLNNSNRQDIDNNNFKNNTQNNIPYNNIQNNYFNNPNKNYYQQGNNTKQMKIFQKPYNLRDNYLKEFYNPKGEKILYNLFKYDLNIYRNSKDKIYQLFQIFEIVKDKLNNKDREEIKNIFNKLTYGFNNMYNNNYYKDNMNMNKNGGNFANNYTHNNMINNYNNNNRKHSFQSQSNNWDEGNYDNTNYNNGINYHQHSNYNNKHNYIDDKNNDELGYNKQYDSHHNSSYNKKTNYKNNYSSRHYYNDKNTNKLKNKSNNRKNSAYGSGAVLVEVSTTPKKGDNEENNKNNENENKETDNAQNIKEDEKIINDNNDVNNNMDTNKEINDVKDINNEIKNVEEKIPEKENIALDNNVNDNNEESKKEDGNILLNEVNISQEMPKEEIPENNNNNNENNNIINDISDKENENGDNNEVNNNNIDNDYEYKDENDNMITDFNFNSINPFNDKNNGNEMSDKEDSSNNLRVIHNIEDNENLNKSKEEDNNDNDENNPFELNILNNQDDLFNNINLYNKENDINKEENHLDQYNDININMNDEQYIKDDNNKEDEMKEDYNIHTNNKINEIEIGNKNQIKNDLLHNVSPKKELIMSNSANNINERINLNQNNNLNINENILINPKSNIQDNSHSNSDNNLMNFNKNNLSKNINININTNDNLNQNKINLNNSNNNLSNEQLQMLRMFMQNNNNNPLLNLYPFLNTNLQKNNIINNILSNPTNFGMNIINNIYSGVNLVNLINENSLNNSNYNGLYYHNNDIQNYNNILFNYTNQEHNLISSLKQNSKNKSTQFNAQSNINFLKMKSDQLAIEYNNKLKKLRDNKPLLVKENLQLFEEKIILPLYLNICEENKQRKEKYTEIYTKYINLIMKILEKNNIKDTKVEPYGSIVNNFMTESGDIDICIVPSDHNLIEDFGIYLEEIKEEAVNEQKCAKSNTLEKYSKFMILKLKDIETEIDLDITVQNILPVINTKLIRLYSLYDQRFHILGIFLKFWVKKNHIHGAIDKFLSSYALLILIIHYLQTITEPKVLPILQQIRNEKKEYIYHNGEKEITTNLYFEEDLEEVKKYMKIINNNENNESSVVELVVGFLEYYSYKYNHYMISISRSDKIPTDENEMIAFPLEDPFDIGYNPGKSMKLNTLSHAAFTYCMKKELNNIISGEYFKHCNNEE